MNPTRQPEAAYLPAGSSPMVHGQASINLRRRAFVRMAASAAAAGLLAGCSTMRRTVGYRPPATERTAFVVSNEGFFVVAVDPSYRPTVSLETATSQWSLDLAGLDGRLRRIGYDDLTARAKRSVHYTLECIGNPVGGSLIGNARWNVIPLKEILRQSSSGVATARSVRFEGLDGFYSSVSIERAMDDYAFLAVGMNGVPLPLAHGFPARVLLPDLYGKKQPRWLKRISLSEDPRTTSYWEQYGWAGEVPVKTTSRFDQLDRVPAGRTTTLSGIAFSGRRGISRVEVSIDSLDKWKPCALASDPAPNIWCLWRYHWESPTPGRYVLWVRAIDGAGHVQTRREQGSFPDGATGLHRIEVSVGGA